MSMRIGILPTHTCNSMYIHINRQVEKVVCTLCICGNLHRFYIIWTMSWRRSARCQILPKIWRLIPLVPGKVWKNKKGRELYCFDLVEICYKGLFFIKLPRELLFLPRSGPKKFLMLNCWCFTAIILIIAAHADT